MFGPFPNPRVGVEIGNAFGRASERIRRQRVQSANREAVGNRARVEPSDTDQLIGDFESAIREEIHENTEDVIGEDVLFDVEFYPTNLPVGEETKYGADFGVRLHIEADSFNVTKGVLFQCKRMYTNAPQPSYDALRGDGEEQAERMLKVTPASFFLLFNGVGAEQIGRWMIPPAAFYSLYRNYGWWRDTWHFFRLGDPLTDIWNTGVMVLPAARVYAESRVAKRESKALRVDAQHWSQGSVPLGVFMADLFGSCLVGDVRTSVLRLVTPPALRDLDVSGVDDEESSMLPVRRLMDVRVTQSPSGQLDMT